MVQGKLTYRSYEDSTGKKHYITEIIVSDFMKLTKATKQEMAAAQQKLQTGDGHRKLSPVFLSIDFG